MIIYVVKPGDSVYSIARRYGIDPQKIISDNELTNPDNLVVGQTLVLITDTIPHTVVRGDSLYRIAQNYGVTLAQIQRANPQITNPARLQIGQVVNVPVPSQKLGDIRVNGYAFPSINTDTLQRTLPYLTYLKGIRIY